METLFPEMQLNWSDPETCANKILEELKDGFEWKDLTIAALIAVKFGENFSELPPAQKAVKAKAVIDLVIDKTDTPYLPDDFSDPIFKEIAHSIIDEVFKI